MRVYTDSTYLDPTRTLLTFDDRDILLAYCAKSWTFWFEDEGDMRKELRRWHRTSRPRYQEVLQQIPLRG